MKLTKEEQVNLAEACICGAIFEDTKGRLCACEIETPAPSPQEQNQLMTMVAPFPRRHDGKHKGKPIMP